MKFSLIIPTLNRSDDLKRLLHSLAAQTCQDFEVIISDQNQDDRVTGLLQEGGWKFPIKHIRSTSGASCARNAGLPHAQGQIITFPDDDSTYVPDLLDRAAAFFDEHPQYAYVAGSTYDSTDSALTRVGLQAEAIHPLKIYQQGVEFTYFFRAHCFKEFRFDEGLGVGCRTPWQSDEGPDLLLRLEARGLHGYYQPSLAIWHPAKAGTYGSNDREKCYRYACGSGYFLRKHRYPFWFFAYLQARTLVGIPVGLLKGKPDMARFYAARWNGRWRGWFGYAAATKN